MNTPTFQAFLNNFEEGDLILGLVNERNEYLNQLKIHLHSANYRNKHVTPDQSNNKIIPRLIDLEGRYAPHNTYRFDDEYLNAHMRYLLNSGKYSPSNDKIDSKKRFDIEEYKYLSACKAAIFKPGSHIHYCLDGINIAAVVNKHEDEKKYNSFTSSELRFIFKHKGNLKDKITFYHLGETCPAPWENLRTKSLWDKFAQTKVIDLYCHEDIHAKEFPAYGDKKVFKSTFISRPDVLAENNKDQTTLMNTSHSIARRIFK